MFWGLILIGINIGCGIKNIRRFKSVLEGCRELKDIETLLYSSVKLQNMLNGKKGAFKAFFWAVLAVIGTRYVCYIIMGNIYLFIAFFMMFLMSLSDFVQAVLLYLHGDECYLAARGIAAIEGVYKKGKCRFVTELSEGGATYIDVYKGEEQTPFRFRVLEKEEEAIRMINHFN